jgi:hypothetical protein
MKAEGKTFIKVSEDENAQNTFGINFKNLQNVVQSTCPGC